MNNTLKKYLYYEEQNPNIKIYCGNNLDIMPLLSKVDIVVTSPPYNFNANGFGLGNKGYEDAKDIGTYLNEQKKIITSSLQIADHVFYNIQMIAGNKNALFKIIGDLSEVLKEIIIWDKKNAEPAMSENVLNSQFEFILVFSKNNKRKFDKCLFKRGTLSNVFRIGKNYKNKYSEFHSAIMPIELPKTILNNWVSNTVLDPYLGSGTTLVACKQLNKNGIGIEINEQFCEIAKKRLKQTTKLNNMLEESLF
jgi:site-specific DNA-methyltransferase (adenine-specific)